MINVRLMGKKKQNGPRFKESFFSRIKNQIIDTFNIYRQIHLDKKYHKEYVTRMREMAQDPSTDFVKLGIKVSEDGETLSSLVQLPNEFIAADEYLIYAKLNDNTVFITSYLRENLGLNLYVSLPEFFRIEDPNKPDDISLSYIAMWNFQPMIEKKRKKKYLWTRNGIISAILLTAAALIVFL